MNGSSRVPPFRAALVQSGRSPSAPAALAVATPTLAEWQGLQAQPHFLVFVQVLAGTPFWRCHEKYDKV